MNKNKSLLWGLVLIIVGVILALNRLNITNINIFFPGWWTLFIIIPSFIGLFDSDGKLSSFIFFIIGVLLLLSYYDLFDMSLVFKLLFPIILIIIGLSLVFKRNIEIPNVKNEKEYYATFSHQDIEVDGKFDGCDLNAVFGSLDCSLLDAKIKNESVINVYSIFGKTNLKVPNDIKVEVKSTSIFGKTSNKVKNKEGKNTLYINAICLFGGLDINGSK